MTDSDVLFRMRARVMILGILVGAAHVGSCSRPEAPSHVPPGDLDSAAHIRMGPRASDKSPDGNEHSRWVRFCVYGPCQDDTEERYIYFIRLPFGFATEDVDYDGDDLDHFLPLVKAVGPQFSFEITTARYATTLGDELGIVERSWSKESILYSEEDGEGNWLLVYEAPAGLVQRADTGGARLAVFFANPGLGVWCRAYDLATMAQAEEVINCCRTIRR